MQFNIGNKNKIKESLSRKGVCFFSRLLFFSLFLCSCKRMIEISPPVGSITTNQTFSSDATAISAAANMYYHMINANGSFSSYAMTTFGGMSADELIPFDQDANDLYIQFQQNTLVSTNSFISSAFWENAYSTIYTANAIIEGLGEYSGVHDSLKNELIGEAEFVRAFCHFYLVNLFGDVPLITTINYNKTSLLSRTPVSQVYAKIISDLQDAQKRLSSDYSSSLEQRIIPNKWAATALLARVYLFLNDWMDAETQATALISNSNLYNLSDLKDVFLANSNEAIWQLQQSNEEYTYNATPEGYALIPFDTYTQPFVYLTTQLLNTFEVGDQRKSTWVNSYIYGGITYYFPYKYKVGPAQAIPDGPYTEYYMVLRLAEQYLIRAEARAQQNKLTDAASDLNMIRKRSGLQNTTAISQSDFLAAIAHERQVEMFCEWGHRWLDLKRTGQTTPVLGPIKSTWTTNAQLYPIPLNELKTDPNLTQNTGY